MLMKKQISFVVTLALVIGIFSVPAFAASTTSGTTTTNPTTGSAITTSQPAVTTTTPAVTTTTPAVKTTAPAVTTTTPAVKTTAPAVTTTAPAVTTTAPAVTAPAVTAPAVTAPAVTVPKTATATPTVSKVLVSGAAVSFDAYNINGNNYFKLRDLASTFNSSKKQFEVGWDATKNAINLKSNSAYTKVGGEMVKSDGKTQKATLSTSKIFNDGKELSLTAYNIGGNNYFKLRDIAQAFNIGVTFDSKTNTISIDTNADYKAE